MSNRAKHATDIQPPLSDDPEEWKAYWRYLSLFAHAQTPVIENPHVLDGVRFDRLQVAYLRGELTEEQLAAERKRRIN